jgi:SAM-dependent methyltransferase
MTTTDTTTSRKAAAIPADIFIIKQRQKTTWESGDFGQVAKTIEHVAGEFMAGLPLTPGLRVLDVACGTGNLAVVAARKGCTVTGIDIASNLVAQARVRAKTEGLNIRYDEGDAESLPYPDAIFEVVVSMYGAMFAPRPDQTATELFRVTKPGGIIALANWTPEGFIGRMFDIFKAHLPPAPGIPSPLLWGDEAIVRTRLRDGVSGLQLNRRIARMRYPFLPADVVEFFREYYGPTHRAFATLDASRQAALRQDLVKLQTEANVSTVPGTTEVEAEYLEVIATRA